jgi:hypothetical protein
MISCSHVKINSDMLWQQGKLEMTTKFMLFFKVVSSLAISETKISPVESIFRSLQYD